MINYKGQKSFIYFLICIFSSFISFLFPLVFSFKTFLFKNRYFQGLISWTGNLLGDGEAWKVGTQLGVPS